ncbi:glycoside hydrolase family 16 protein [Nonlabens marinus]|uniref:glycoside hydrolase family 16 protein n=1 Tax=Nonlabens marinus TaxID=930802 RepID=UPI00269B3E8E|nr:glycoside hydrolase family 16 protein [Nonlabens marinus]
MKNILKRNCCISMSIGFLFSTLVTATFFGCSNDEQQEVTTLNKLVLSEEFNVDGAPDPNLWSYDLGDGSARGLVGWGNNELQSYTDRPRNVVVEDGMLKITAYQENFENSGYTSARILTEGKFQKKYGRFEARMKLPWGQGIWPAFWMLGDDQNGTLVWPQLGEIDIMEYRGQNPTVALGSVHGPGYSGGEAVSKSYSLINDRFDTDFHIFGIEWGPDYINYYIDDVLYNQITPADVNGEWVFNNNEFYMLINLAVGGSFVGAPNQNTVFPQTLLVDYVRVYE